MITSAILLSAGRGERLRPLTDNLPKALMPVQGKPLIVHHIEKLAQAGIKNIVINISYLAHMIQQTLKDGKKFGVNIIYSYEPEALETGGGILQALPLLGAQPFLVISSDIFTGYDFQQLRDLILSDKILAHIVLVPNPDYHPQGDYGLDRHCKVILKAEYTYSSVAVIHPALFTPEIINYNNIINYYNDSNNSRKFRLASLFNKAIDKGLVSGELYSGPWYNVGTVEEYEKACKNSGS